MGQRQTDTSGGGHEIGKTLRELRLGRRWTQAELATRLGVTQGYLSKIERGYASLSAEQFLEVLAIFNVGLDAFIDMVETADSSLQNALARYGAAHLRVDPRVRVDPQHESPRNAIRAVLLDPRSSRLITALAPVFVVSADSIALPALHHDLAVAGVANRLGWAVENTVHALKGLDSLPDRRQALLLNRAWTVLSTYSAPPPPADAEVIIIDPFDQDFRSPRSLRQAWSDGSPISRRWHIATAIEPEDFTRALRQALESR